MEFLKNYCNYKDQVVFQHIAKALTLWKNISEFLSITLVIDPTKSFNEQIIQKFEYEEKFIFSRRILKIYTKLVKIHF